MDRRARITSHFKWGRSRFPALTGTETKSSHWTLTTSHCTLRTFLQATVPASWLQQEFLFASVKDIQVAALMVPNISATAGVEHMYGSTGTRRSLREQIFVSASEVIYAGSTTMPASMLFTTFRTIIRFFLLVSLLLETNVSRRGCAWNSIDTHVSYEIVTSAWLLLCITYSNRALMSWGTGNFFTRKISQNAFIKRTVTRLSFIIYV